MTMIGLAAGTQSLALGFAPDIDWISTLLLATACAIVVFAAGAGVGIKYARRRRSNRAGPGPAAPHALTEQRDALVGGCVKARGLLDDQLLTDVLDDALRGGGVSVFDATGAPMDRSRHRIDHTVPAPDPSADGIVAQTLAPGYLDNGRVLRPAEVVVYKWNRS
jgi:molecular chaperone GrpE